MRSHLYMFDLTTKVAIGAEMPAYAIAEATCNKSLAQNHLEVRFRIDDALEVSSSPEKQEWSVLGGFGLE